jgi:hypothetical protein
MDLIHGHKHTVEHFFHLISVGVANLGIDQTGPGLGEDDTLHGSGLLCCGYDILCRFDERMIDVIIRM